MKDWTIYIGITAVFVFIYLFYSKIKKGFIQNMSKILYADNNPDLFLKKLEGFEGKLFIDKKTRLFRSIDAYAIKQDSEKIVDLFKQLESRKLSFGQKVSLYEKEVNFYVENQMYEDAVKANEQVQNLNSQLENEDLNKIAINCDALIKIYVNHDGSLANEMIKCGDEATINTVKGTYYFRAAKCFYYKKDAKMTTKYLEKAYRNLSHTSWEKIIKKCLDNQDNLKKY